MYDEIASNQRKTWMIIIFFVAFIAFLGYVLGLVWADPFVGMALAVIVSLVFTLISYYSGDKMLLKLSGARPTDKKLHPHLVNTVEGLAIAAGMPTPQIFIIESDAINAFATGRAPSHSSVTVTTGALKKLNRTELEGVIGHEMSHIKNYDIRVMMVTVMLVGIIALLSDVILRSMWYGKGDSKEAGRAGIILLVIGLILAILAPFIAEILKLAVSRRREYLADASGALLTRHPPGLASALKKIRDDKTVLKQATTATAPLYISNPLKDKFHSLFSTHPDINDRIRRLEQM